MNSLYPVYTLKNECHDCYKCVRHCPVKAIRIEGGHASVLNDRCIACGNCVMVCPSKAKRVRDDLDKVKKLIADGHKVYVSLAPSWVGVFKSEVTYKHLLTGLKKLGFSFISETALGAEEVSAKVARDFADKKYQFAISSACPVIVDYIRLYHSEYTKYITSIASPAMTHAKMLKEKYGQDIKVVFIGPCIAKKNEADFKDGLIDVSITFKELRSWLKQEKIDLAKIEADESIDFVPHKAHEGSLYPIEGGMNQTLERYECPKDVQLICVSGLDTFKDAIKGLDPEDLKHPVFIEGLACDGGCVNGPCARFKKAGIATISKVMNNTTLRDFQKLEPKTVVKKDFKANPIKKDEPSLEQIVLTMESIGKYGIEDELNCSGCGYDTCRELAKALIAGDAEPSMCVSYMRLMAMRKANAMLRCMPAGVVIVDSDMNIVEENEAFEKMFAKDLYEFFAHKPDGMAKVALDRVLPCVDLFKTALRADKDITREHYEIEGRLYNITVFPIEPKKVVGAVIWDVTKTHMRRDQIAKKAQEVISKNISTVQEIACLLGEHMVETELLLSTIADEFEEE